MNKQKTLIFSLSAILFLALSFIVYSWNEPVANMPSGYTAPLNTSSIAQTKTGEIGASMFRDADNPNYYINPSGNSVVSGKIIMENSTSSGDIPTTIATKGYVDTEIARVESLVNGSLPLVYNMHTREACTTAGGTVVDSDVSLPMCRFNAAACPANWTQYKNFSTTVGKTCQIGYTMRSGTYNCPAVITGDHAWSNVPHESKPTYELNYTGICGRAHSSYGGPFLL
jgi:hypothetical protein